MEPWGHRNYDEMEVCWHMHMRVLLCKPHHPPCQFTCNNSFSTTIFNIRKPVPWRSNRTVTASLTLSICWMQRQRHVNHQPHLTTDQQTPIHIFLIHKTKTIACGLPELQCLAHLSISPVQKVPGSLELCLPTLETAFQGTHLRLPLAALVVQHDINLAEEFLKLWLTRREDGATGGHEMG